jgi:2-polyprenyl-3-methyl-5-hydroxy-6-metoxy-1,4-benzoquinol methylase
MDNRKQSEKEFHNNAFSTNKREKLDVFYSITQQSADFYISNVLRNSKDKSILEYGCGVGSMAFGLADGGANVTAIDISESGIDIAKNIAVKRNLNISFFVMDAEATEFPDNSFDVVCGSGILHHLDLNSSYNEIRRLVRFDGKAVFSEPLAHNPLINLYRILTPNLRTKDEHPLKVKDIKMLEKYFNVVDANYYNLWTLFAIPFSKTVYFNRILTVLSSIDNKFLKLFPFMKRFCWTVILILKSPKK